MKKICQSCHTVFEVEEKYSYVMLCRRCFYDNKMQTLQAEFDLIRNKKLNSSTQISRTELERLRTENATLKARVQELEADLALRDDKFSLGLFNLIKLKNTALEHELEQLKTAQTKKPLPTGE